jgi:hypothetical protein
MIVEVTIKASLRKYFTNALNWPLKRRKTTSISHNMAYEAAIMAVVELAHDIYSLPPCSSSRNLTALLEPTLAAAKAICPALPVIS